MTRVSILMGFLVLFVSGSLAQEIKDSPSTRTYIHNLGNAIQLIVENSIVLLKENQRLRFASIPSVSHHHFRG